MKVSIVTVSYNSASTIRDTIESVLAQDYPDIEYLVIDGGSSDRTVDIVSEFGDHIDVLISEPDRGIYDAMNKGIRNSTGDLIGMLNSDDFYSDTNALSRLIRRLQEKGSDMVFADLAIVDPRDTSHVIRYYDSGRFDPSRLRYGWMPAHPTLLVKRRLYRQVGEYSLDYRIAADFEMMVRLFHGAGGSYAYLPDIVVMMRAGGISTSGLKNSWLLNQEIVRACRNNGIDTSLPRVLLKIPFKLMEYLRKPK